MMLRKSSFFAAAIAAMLMLALQAAPIQAQTQKSGPRMDRSRINIGAYTLQDYATSEAHVKDIADCGIDFILGLKTDYALLDLFQKYHIGAVLNKVVPGWWGGDGTNAGKLEKRNTLQTYQRKALKFKDHPAIWGIDIGDETSALDFPYYGTVYATMQKYFPKQFIYLNLLPNYATMAKNTADKTVNQLGTTTYQEYIDNYVKNVPSDYISFDYYLYNVPKPQMYENLRIVADACTKTDRSMWVVLQANSYYEKEWTSENRLRFQAYSAMSFGAEVIMWACYTAGWWHNQIVDENGNKTQQYNKVKRVNAEIHNLSDAYMKYRRVTTHLVGFNSSTMLGEVNIPLKAAYNGGAFSGLQTFDKSALLVGEMTSRDGTGRQALFICAADDPYDKAQKKHTLIFASTASKLKATNGKGEVKVKKNKQGFYSLTIKSNEGVLLEVAD